MNDLAANIKKYRKENGFTQEELAEKLGITLGTISKWERSASEPELDYIMEMAEIFHVSVDVLIGFRMKGLSVDGILDNIRTNRNTRHFEEALAAADKAIRRFPNNINVVYESACTYLTYWFDNKENKEVLKKAYDGFRHTLDLFPSDNPEINEINVKRVIADCLTYMGENEKALDMYKESNIGYMNHFSIAYLLLSGFGDVINAEKYNKRVMLAGIENMVNALQLYMNIYYHTNTEMCIRSCDQFMDLVESLRRSEGHVFMDKFIPRAYMYKGISYVKKGDRKEGRKLIAEAVKKAKTYDADPSLTLDNLLFLEDMEGWQTYDLLSASAMDSLNDLIEKELKEEDRTLIRKLYDEVKNDKE